MTPASIRDFLHTLRPRCLAAARAGKHEILDEFCATADYNRKSAIRALNTPRAAWCREAEALLPLWLPWALRRMKS